MATYLLTGATSPLGHSVVQTLRAAGHTSVAVVRNPKSEAAATLPADLLHADLSDPAALDALNLTGIDGFMHLAGVLHLTRRAAAGGVDCTWATNVLGPLRLAHRLIPSLADGAPVAIISGEAHRRAPLSEPLFASSGLRAAMQATTAKVLWTRALARHHPRLQSTTFCPGRVQSGLHRGLPWPASWVARALLATGDVATDVGPLLTPHLLQAFRPGTYTIRGTPTPAAEHSADVALQDAVWAAVQAWPLS